jgi:hypothetical protein
MIGMLRGHRLQAIKNERKLETNQMFAPRGPVIIESCDSLRGLNELRAASRDHTTDKI